MEIEKLVRNFKDGSYAEYYHKKGKRGFWHREDGPAYIIYNKDGSIEYQEYQINNVRLSKEEWEKEVAWRKQLKDTPMGEIYGN